MLNCKNLNKHFTKLNLIMIKSIHVNFVLQLLNNFLQRKNFYTKYHLNINYQLLVITIILNNYESYERYIPNYI